MDSFLFSPGQRVPAHLYILSDRKAEDFIILKHRAEQRGIVVPVGVHDLSVYVNCPACRSVDAEKQFDKRAFSGSVFADDRYLLVRADSEADILKGVFIAAI